MIYRGQIRTSVNMYESLYLDALHHGISIHQFEGECSWTNKTQRNNQDALLGVDDTLFLLHELHANVEEEWLDKRVVLILCTWLGRVEQLPGGVLWHVTVDEVGGLRQEVEIIILIHKVLGGVALRLQIPTHKQVFIRNILDHRNTQEWYCIQFYKWYTYVCFVIYKL